jgi:hypothetical protein
VDFTNHPHNRLSIIDKTKKFNQSIIDYRLKQLRLKLHDPNLGAGMVALALSKLSEADIDNIADYALRKGNHPGKAFVGLCNKLIKERDER